MITGSIQDVRYLSENLNSTIIIFESRDGTSVEFKIKRNIHNYYQQQQTSANNQSAANSGGSNSNISGNVNFNVVLERARINSPLFKSGLGE